MKWKRRLAWIIGLWFALVVVRGLWLLPARAFLRIPLGILSHLINPIAEVPAYPRLRAENRALRQTVAVLTRELVETDALKAENARLHALLQLSDAHPHLDVVMADVVARNPTQWNRAIWIDRGQRDGLALGTPVIAAEGLVGKVATIESATSFVLLVTDPEVRIGALVSRTRDQGIVQGQGTQLLRLTYLHVDADVQVGDYVVTSGLGDVYPKGLPIGQVIAVAVDASGLYRVATVKPATPLGQLETVACLVKP